MNYADGRFGESVLQSNWPDQHDVPHQGAGTRAIEGVRALAAAILKEAIHCSSSYEHSKWVARDQKGQGNEVVIRARQARDRSWLESDRELAKINGRPFFTYCLCCEILDFNHVQLRELIRAAGWLDGSARFEVRKLERIFEAAAAHG